MLRLSKSEHERYAKKLKTQIDADLKARNDFERAFGLGPKVSILHAFMTEISDMLQRLYSISEQRKLFKNSVKDFDITEDTYRKFLRDHMRSDYDLYLKNMYFMRSYTRILKACEEHSDYVAQFSALGVDTIGSGRRQISLTVEDYIYFCKTYFADIEAFFDRKKIEETKHINKEMYFNENGKLIINNNPVQPIPQTFENEQLGLNKTAETIGNKPAEAILRSVYQAANENSDEEYEVNLMDVIQIGLRKGVVGNNIPQVFPIYDNKEEFPKEVKVYIERDSTYIKEDFLYFLDSRLIQAAKYPFTDGLLIICGTNYKEDVGGYDCFRWYKGGLYFLQNFKPTSSFTSFGRAFMDKEMSTTGESFRNYVYSEWVEYNGKY